MAPLLARNIRTPLYDFPSKVKISPLDGFNVTTESRALPLTAILLPRTPTDTTLWLPTLPLLLVRTVTPFALDTDAS